jgi:hypothetical protein
VLRFSKLLKYESDCDQTFGKRKSRAGMNIAFFVRQFSERGTEVATYDYAYYNKTLLHNTSIIICFTPEKQATTLMSTDRPSYEKFKKQFPIVEINDMSDMKTVIQEYKLDFFYALASGGGNDFYQFENKDLWQGCKTIKHAVFDLTYPEGDFYLSISSYLNTRYCTSVPVVPHIVKLPDRNETLRTYLKIPEDALVLGRYGGLTEFNIPFVAQVIIDYIQENPNVYFIFMNTPMFYQHPRVLYLEKTVDLDIKTMIINTCDAMIHARIEGETFGLSCGEFSSRNKPVITCPSGDLEHVWILKEKGLLYRTPEELICIFRNLKTTIASRSDWNAYRQFSPEAVMKHFKAIFDTKLSH